MYLKSTYIRVSNVKLSVKIPDTSIQTLIDLCVKENFEHKAYGNFVVLKVPSVSSNNSLYTFTVFKRSMLKQCDENAAKQHVNATKVLLNEIDDCIKTLRWILDCGEACVLDYQIDNLTATCSLGRKINIEKFIERNPMIQNKITFNVEKFPACFITFKGAKVVLFRSGIFNVLACKSFEEIKEAFSWISEITAYT